MISEATEALNAKAEALRKHLVESPAWRSVMAKVELGMDLECLGPLIDIASMAKTSDGMEPWLMVCKAFGFRYGPAHVPLPGCGTLVSVLGKGVEVYIAAMPITGRLEKGISPEDIPTFLATSTGMQFFKDSCIFFRLPGHGVAYIPYGWSAIPLVVPMNFLEAPEAKKADVAEEKDKGKETLDCPLLFTPLLDANWATEFGRAGWAAVHERNETYLQTAAAKRLWAGRATMWGQFATGVQPEWGIALGVAPSSYTAQGDNSPWLGVRGLNASGVSFAWHAHVPLRFRR